MEVMLGAREKGRRHTKLRSCVQGMSTRKGLGSSHVCLPFGILRVLESPRNLGARSPTLSATRARGGRPCAESHPLRLPRVRPSSQQWISHPTHKSGPPIHRIFKTPLSPRRHHPQAFSTERERGVHSTSTASVISFVIITASMALHVGSGCGLSGDLFIYLHACTAPAHRPCIAASPLCLPTPRST
jgi:hypothetical protein